jgi:chloramphenicol 3-O phosphotransferase
VIVFLNGASSAGKTSIGTALQDLLDEPHLLLGLDTLFGMVPVRYGSTGTRKADGFRYERLPDDETAILYGDDGWRMMLGFHRAVAELARPGNDLIVDEVLLDGRVRDDWRAVLEPFDVLWVGVHCAVDELERREAGRRSPAGLARWSSRQAHEGMVYDVTVDTTTASAMDCATTITAAATRRSRPAT